MTGHRPPRLVAAIAAGLAEGHRFCDDILGDLEVEYRDRRDRHGSVSAAWWYAGQAVRVPVGWRRSVRLAALASSGYLVILWMSAAARPLVPSSLWGLAVIGASAAFVGGAMRRVAGGAGVPALLVLWAIALAIGVPYIVQGTPREFWLHVSKVVLVLIASGLGCLREPAAPSVHQKS